jgi:hypothetical protein
MGKEFVKTLLKDEHIVYGSLRRLEKMRNIEKMVQRFFLLTMREK